MARSSRHKLDQASALAAVAELEHYDATIAGSGDRYGLMALGRANLRAGYGSEASWSER